MLYGFKFLYFVHTLHPRPISWPYELGTHFSQTSPRVFVGQTHLPVSGSHMCPGLIQYSHAESVEIKGLIFLYFGVIDVNIPLHPVLEKPKNPVKHVSHFRPPIPGLQ